MILNFHGGVKIEAKKLFAESEIKNIDSCSAVCINAGEDYEAVVDEGSDVLRGTLIGFSDGTPIYSPVAGSFNGVMEIEGGMYFVVMNNGEEGEETLFSPETRSILDLTREDIITAARQYAIIDSRSGRPLWKLLSEAGDCRRVVIDCTEPFAHSAIAERLCIEKARSAVFGAKLLLHSVGALKCVFAMEAGKKTAMEALNPYISDEKLFAIAPMEEKYPYGDRALMYGIYIKTLAEGETARDYKVLIVGIEAAIALFDAMASGIPQTHKYITVCGDGIKNGGNFRVPRGITAHDLAEIVGGFPGDRPLIRNTLLSGVPMGGAVDDGTIALIPSEKKDKQRMPCISCGACAEACPVQLVPAEVLLGRNEMLKKKCVSCGGCEYICPGNIPLLKLIKGEEDTENDG